MYKIQTRDNEESEWRDMNPIKGWFDHIDLSYNDARSIVKEYKELSKTKNYRTIKQAKNDTIMSCVVCKKSIKITETYGSTDGGITHVHDECLHKKLRESLNHEN